MKKNHSRAPGMKQTSIAIPKTLMDRIDAEALRQRRKRNNLIMVLLDDAVTKYEHEALSKNERREPMHAASVFHAQRPPDLGGELSPHAPSMPAPATRVPMFVNEKSTREDQKAAAIAAFMPYLNEDDFHDPKTVAIVNERLARYKIKSNGLRPKAGRRKTM